MREYEDKIFMITMPEGGSLASARVEAFSGFAVTGDVYPHQNVVFYAKVAGMQDLRAPSRNWGKNFWGKSLGAVRKRVIAAADEGLKRLIQAKL